MAMRTADRLVRLLSRPLDSRIRRAVAEHAETAAHGADPQRLLYEPQIHGDRERLHVHPTAVLNNALLNLSGGEITVEADAFFGHYVSILTGTHDVEKFGRERQEAIKRTGQDVVVGAGAWLASHVVVVGPCRIGAHSVVGVGSLVLHDVDPYTVVAGVPAKPLRTLERPGS